MAASLKKFFKGLALAALPAGLYVAACLNPATVTRAWIVGLAALAGAVVAGSRWGAPALLLAAFIVMPKMMWAVRMNRSGIRELFVERERLEAARKAKGAVLTAAELGRLPVLRIWATDGQWNEHYHAATDHVTVVSSGTAIPDDGGWGYDPATGRLFIACAGFDPKGGRPLSDR